MVQKRTLELTETERAALVEHRDHDTNPQIRERCAALLKIAAGQSAYAVARQGLLKPRDPDTVYEWLDWYEQDGLDGLLSRLQGGNHRSFRGEESGSGGTLAASTRGRAGCHTDPLDVATYPSHV